MEIRQLNKLCQPYCKVQYMYVYGWGPIKIYLYKLVVLCWWLSRDCVLYCYVFCIIVYWIVLTEDSKIGDAVYSFCCCFIFVPFSFCDVSLCLSTIVWAVTQIAFVETFSKLNGNSLRTIRQAHHCESFCKHSMKCSLFYGKWLQCIMLNTTFSMLYGGGIQCMIGYATNIHQLDGWK